MFFCLCKFFHAYNEKKSFPIRYKYNYYCNYGNISFPKNHKFTKPLLLFRGGVLYN